MKKLIAVIEDERDIAELISIHLSKAGFSVKTFADGTGFFRFLEKKTPDLAVLDLMLPDIDGLEICKHIRSNEAASRVPIIILTAKGEEVDRIIGLELGADDYVAKPFSPKELVARVKAVLRRSGGGRETSRAVVAGVVSVDLDRYAVNVAGRSVDLTPAEFRILVLLLSGKGRVFSRERILDHLWGDEKAVIDRTVDVHIRHLRDKLGPEAGGYIKNVRGVGYKLEA